jgi:hypothetical protein
MMAWQAANLLDASDALLDQILHQRTHTQHDLSMFSSFTKLNGMACALEAYHAMPLHLWWRKKFVFCRTAARTNKRDIAAMKAELTLSCRRLEWSNYAYMIE